MLSVSPFVFLLINILRLSLMGLWLQSSRRQLLVLAIFAFWHRSQTPLGTNVTIVFPFSSHGHLPKTELSPSLSIHVWNLPVVPVPRRFAFPSELAYESGWTNKFDTCRQVDSKHRPYHLIKPL
jgi:hypothetical protein